MCCRDFRRLTCLGFAHDLRKRPPAVHERWFGKPKEQDVSLKEYDMLDDARGGIAGYVDRHYHRPHSGLDYRTPFEVPRA